MRQLHVPVRDSRLISDMYLNALEGMDRYSLIGIFKLDPEGKSLLILSWNVH